VTRDWCETTFAQRTQHVLEGIGGVGIVDDDERSRASAHPFHAAGHRLEPSERSDRSAQLHAAREQHRQRGEQVVRVVAAERGLATRAAPHGVLTANLTPSGPVTRSLPATRSVRVPAVPPKPYPITSSPGRRMLRARTRPKSSSTFTTACVSDSQQRDAPWLPVALHRCVIVEMVAGEIREQRDVELDAGDAVLVESDRRHLHRNRLRARAGEIRQAGVQPDGIGVVFSSGLKGGRRP
jgi:hypothetical protein